MKITKKIYNIRDIYITKMTEFDECIHLYLIRRSGNKRHGYYIYLDIDEIPTVLRHIFDLNVNNSHNIFNINKEIYCSYDRFIDDVSDEEYIELNIENIYCNINVRAIGVSSLMLILENFFNNADKLKINDGDINFLEVFYHNLISYVNEFESEEYRDINMLDYNLYNVNILEVTKDEEINKIKSGLRNIFGDNYEDIWNKVANMIQKGCDIKFDSYINIINTNFYNLLMLDKFTDEYLRDSYCHSNGKCIVNVTNLINPNLILLFKNKCYKNKNVKDIDIASLFNDNKRNILFVNSDAGILAKLLLKNNI